MDTREWKEYKFKDIFTIEKGKELVGDNEDGKTPLISSTESNNGFCAFISNGNLLFDGNKITVASNGSVGSAFYQQQDFYTTTDVNILTLKNHQLNKYIALFFCSIIEFEKYKFGYGRKWNLDKMFNSTFSLPTTQQGEPDWQFMEDYIKKIYNKVIEEVKASAPALLSLSLSLKNRPVLKCDEWKEFRVGELFEIKKCKAFNYCDSEEGNYIYITRTAENNGMTGNIKLEDNSYLNKRNCITIGGEGIYAFYQQKEFIGGTNITAIYNKNFNKNVCLFLCTVLNSQAYKYNYGRARNLQKIKDEIVLLPTTPQGEPDWEWMERYVKKLMR